MIPASLLASAEVEQSDVCPETEEQPLVGVHQVPPHGVAQQSEMDLYLSLGIEDIDGAVVYLNSAELAVWNVPGSCIAWIKIPVVVL